MIYFDNGATTFFKPYEVKVAVNQAINLYTANAGRGGHKLAQISAEKIYGVREKILKFFDVKNHQCVFTAGCTSALNLAILGSFKQGGHVITTYLEHNSVLRPLEYLKSRKNFDYSVVQSLDINSFEQAILPNTYMIITTQASNVTGERPDIKKINKLCKKYGLLHLVDTAQGAGHIFESLDMVDMIAFAGHKGLYGLGGVGGLVVRDGIQLNPIMFGGTGTMSESLIQPSTIPEGLEVGTQANIPIISLGAGIDYVLKNKDYIIAKENLLHNEILKMFNRLDFVKLYGKGKGVYSFNVGDLDSSFVSDYLNDRFGICTRSGLHCAPLVHRHFNTQDRGMVRVSLSHNNSVEEIEVLENALKSLKQKHENIKM